MRGKSKCKILKEIRQKIADENDIPYVTRECTYQGECSGTCPKCEAELRYLEQQLEKRQRLGKRVTVAALAASLMTGLVGCPEGTSSSVDNRKVSEVSEKSNLQTGAPDILAESTENSEFAGVPVEDEVETPELIGEVAYTPETELEGLLPEDYEELDGDVEYISEAPDLDLIAGMIAAEEDTDEPCSIVEDYTDGFDNG